MNHDFDWRRESGSTPSGTIGTGPSFDHTLGPGMEGKVIPYTRTRNLKYLFTGHYMYIESSFRNVNDTARLISPVFDQVEENVCLEFYYHMFGETIGSLRVYVKRDSDSWNFSQKTTVFSKSGNQGNKWHRTFQELGIIDEDFQVRNKFKKICFDEISF